MRRLILPRIPSPWLTFAAVLLLLELCGYPAHGATAAGGEIAADTLWEGAVDVTAPVFVQKGATLLIQPGTIVRFAAGQDETGQPKASLTIHGTFVAQGTAAEPILFTSAAEQPQPGDWHGFHGEGKPAPVVVESSKITTGIDIVLKRME